MTSIPMEVNLSTPLLLFLYTLVVLFLSIVVQSCRQTAKRSANTNHKIPSSVADSQELPAVERTLFRDLYQSQLRVEFHDRRRKYIPVDAVRRCVIYGAVLRELRRADASPEEELQSSAANTHAHLANWICETAQKLFAIVILCDLSPYNVVEAMRCFKEHGYGDNKLPILDPATVSSPSSISPGFSQTIWNVSKLDWFHEQQWKILVPIFSPDEYDYDLPMDTIFPFTLQHTIPKEGAFSSVYRVAIHKAHNKWPEVKEVALKELKVSNNYDDEQRAIDQAWNNEARALHVIKKLNHGHIVKCIAAIRRGDSRYFMFPWADGDNLRDFWNDAANHKPPDANIVRQAIVQLKGIADALESLHNFSGGYNGDDNESNTAHSINVPNQRSSTFNVDDDAASQITLNNEVDDYRHAERAHSIRHGDLKPENILRFKDKASTLGTLKIADMGLAKRHVVATQLRSQGTTTRYSTRRYEAPETVANAGAARSRLYDLWSMGCIVFEFVVWILYGNAELQNLYSQLEANAQQTCQYYEILIPTNEDPGGPRVHQMVSQWMQFMQNKDPECTSHPSALSDLLRIVRERLLVVPLPPDRQSNVERGRQFPMRTDEDQGTVYRATAKELRNELDAILKRMDNSAAYAFRGGDRTNIKPPTPSSTLLRLPTAKHAGNLNFASAAPGISSQLLSVKGLAIRQGSSDYTMPPHQGWIFEIDNVFAEQVQQIIGEKSLKLKHRKISTLCTTCASFNFWKGGFEVDEKVSDLFHRASSCELCKMLYDIYDSSADPKGDSALFIRNESTMMLAGDKFPVLSILRSTPLNTLIPVQLGFPELPEAGSEVFFSIVRAWLNDCDENHPDCKGKEHSLPARLIHVGTTNAPALRLIDVAQESVTNVQYIALSHRWGDEKTCPSFRTLVENEDRFKQAIPEQDLPKTFADAVKTTRELNIQYLWIDSLCIRQGVGGDFEVQSKTMESVFSGAYCVLAASRASNQRDGFLDERVGREYVTIADEHDKVFYICRNIDNFGKDVIEGQLNKRGWVLQERVLARRTVYFTESQTYFECGSGVRCETMTKLQNDMAQFLGDPNFPRKVQQANRGGKIMVFKDLFRQYSRLDLTRDTDRPFAIAGLEKRLHGALQTKGGYGIFDDGDHEDGGLFHRSLLWQKGKEMARDQFLARIQFDNSTEIPTWSWMAYKGGIDYIDLPGKSAIWETKELTPPWTGGGLRHIETGQSQGTIAISAVVRSFAVAGRGHNEVELKYDTGRTSASDGQAASCVVIAKAREGRSDRDRRHYVLLVTPTHQVTGRGDKIYERVGAGYMLGKFIALDTPGVKARIV